MDDHSTDHGAGGSAGPPGARHGTPEGARPEPKRQCLLDACMAVVGRHGYRQATVSQICQAAGATIRDFYEQFLGKEECFIATFRSKGRDLMERAAHAYQEADGPWEARLGVGLEMAMRELAGDACFAHFIAEVNRAGSVGMESINAIIEDAHRILLPDEVRPERASLQETVLVTAVSGAIVHTIATWVWRGRTGDLPEVVPWLSSYVVLMVTSGPPAGPPDDAA